MLLDFWKKIRLCRDQTGATAVEFALIAPAFFVFVLGIMDLSAYYFVQGHLQTAIEQTAREIRVGNASIVGSDDAQKQNFRTLVCDNIHTGMVRNCTTDLLVDVRSFSGDFSGISYGGIGDVNSDGVINWNDTTYDTGEGGDAVVARVYYVYNFLIPQMAILTGGTAGSHKFVAITATTAFRNEPY